MNFQERLNDGEAGEKKIAAWLMSQGWTIYPSWEATLGTRPPYLYTPDWHGSVPDFLCGRDGETQWYELKTKHRFSWNPRICQWQTGMDVESLEHYVAVRDLFSIPLCVLFYHLDNTPSDKDKRQQCPCTCPRGLYGAEIRNLAKCVEHVSASRDAFGEHRGRGSQPAMAYWCIESFVPLATLDEIDSAAAAFGDHPFVSMRCSYERKQPGGAF